MIGNASFKQTFLPTTGWKHGGTIVSDVLRRKQDHQTEVLCELLRLNRGVSTSEVVGKENVIKEQKPNQHDVRGFL